VKVWAVVVLGTIWCALAALLADRAPWLEALAQSFVPYVMVPLVLGLLAARRPAWLTGVLGVAAAVAMVGTFYLTTALDSAYPSARGGHGSGPWSARSRAACSH
jgi:hypothetical protein